MDSGQGLRFKIASEESELEQIYELNYRTFVEEIPQHEPNPAGSLVDTFDKENTYIIAMKSGRKMPGVARNATSLKFSIPTCPRRVPFASFACCLWKKACGTAWFFAGLPAASRCIATERATIWRSFLRSRGECRCTVVLALCRSDR